MPAARKKNFHLPLDEDLYRRLAAEARRVHRPTTTVAREAIARYLTEQERAEVEQQLRQYAEAVAGSPDDLDEAMSEASEALLADGPEGDDEAG